MLEAMETEEPGAFFSLLSNKTPLRGYRLDPRLWNGFIRAATNAAIAASRGSLRRRAWGVRPPWCANVKSASRVSRPARALNHHRGSGAGFEDGHRDEAAFLGRGP